MRVLILGCGLMGPAAAFYAQADPQVRQVTVADRNAGSLAEAEGRLVRMAAGEKLATAVIDVADHSAAVELMRSFDVIIAALPKAASAPAIRGAAGAKVPLVDLTRPSEEQLPELSRLLEKEEGLALIGCGVDPGLTEIMARHLAERLDQVIEVQGKVGGLPEKPFPPLGYKIVYGGRQLPLQEEEARVVTEGEIRAVPRYSGVEAVSFPGVGEVEAYHEGFPSWLLELPVFRGLRRGSQKTLRWPGYAQKAALLRDLGLLGSKPVRMDGAEVVPKRLLDALLAEKMQLVEGERDLTLFRVEVSGQRQGRTVRHRIETVDRYHDPTGLTSMARITGFTAAIVARMVARGAIRAKGLLSPERVITDKLFHRLVMELAAVGIRFTLTREESESLG